MKNFSDFFMPLLAQQAAPSAPGGGGGGGSGELLTMLVTFMPLILLFYFLIIMPQRRQEKQRQKMIAALKKNDRVLTSAGIYGTVEFIDENEDRMVLRAGPSTTIEVTRSSIARVLEPAQKKSGAVSN